MKTVAENAVIHPVGRGCADSDHGEVVHKEHERNEDRQSQKAVGNDLVDFVGGRKLSFLLILVNAVDDLSDIKITLVGNDTLSVVVIFFFDELYVLFNVFFGRFIKTELFDYLFVALKDLDRVPTLLFLGQLVNARFLNMSDSVLDRAFKGVLGNWFFVLGSLDRGFGGFLNSLVFQRGNLNHRTTQRAAQFLGVDFNSCFLHNVHHIDCDNDGDAKLTELSGQIQVAL